MAAKYEYLKNVGVRYIKKIGLWHGVVLGALMDDAALRTRLGLKKMEELQKWLIARETAKSGGVVPLLIELPGIPRDLGFQPIEISLPDQYGCPCGTKPKVE